MSAERRPGRHIETVAFGETVRAFVPAPLPPDPPLHLHPLLNKLADAERKLGALDAISDLLPDPELFQYMYARKEAVLSSQIEGTQSTLTTLLRADAEGRTRPLNDDLREAFNYTAAMDYVLERLETLPLSLRLIREAHEQLMQSVRGFQATPGEFRRSQNWIGGTRPGNARFVPPPVPEMHECLDRFERFIHTETPDMPPIIQAALLHHQFETIHPFLDGNGRVGRLLIVLFLCARGVLRRPILYPSLYFKRRRDEYYAGLQNVRDHGDWEGWIAFFLEAVAESAAHALDMTRRIRAMFEEHRGTIVGEGGARASSALRVHDALCRRPFASVSDLASAAQLSRPTVRSCLERLSGLDLVREVTGASYGRLYSYYPYVALLDEDSDRPFA